MNINKQTIDQEKLALAKKVLNMLIGNDKKDGIYDHLHMNNWEWPVAVG